MTINLGYGPMSGPHCIDVPDCEMCQGSGRVLIVGDAEPVAAEEDDSACGCSKGIYVAASGSFCPASA